MAIYRANTQQDGYCYSCRQDASISNLTQCEKCKNWFCEKHIASVEDQNSLRGDMINLCDKHQGKPTL